MSFADVVARVRFTGFSASAEAAITGAMQTAYNGSATARGMFEDWISDPAKTIPIKFVNNDMFVTGVGGPNPVLSADVGFVVDNSYIDNHGKAVEDTLVTCLVHEFVHQLTGRRDLTSGSDPLTDYQGDTVRFANIIYRELGLPEQNSYIAYDSDGTLLKRGFNYTNGTEIDRSFVGDRDFSSVAALVSDDLLIGGASANTLESGLGNDFLFGAGGDDTLSGGISGTDTAVLTGKPVDYDIRLNPDGTWTARHIRGTADEGTDTFINLEKVQFAGGQTFDLAKGGLTFQNDVAFVVDETGSMGDDIAAVQAAATGVVNGLFAAGTIDARIGIVGFRDTTIGEPTEIVLEFTDQDAFADRQAAALTAIGSLSASGGGDSPETAFDGLLQALNGSMGDWRLGAGKKEVVLFTDAEAKDASLLPTVLSYANDIGAVITSRSSHALGTIGAVDTFELSGIDHSSSGRDPESDGFDFPDFVPSGDPIGPPGETATVRVTTIFIDTFISPDPTFEELAEGTGGSVRTASDPDEVVADLLDILTSATYRLTVDAPTVVEGHDGTTDVTFTLSRDRGALESEVTFETTGTGDSDDVSGAPTTVSFAAGQLSKTITVSVHGDSIDEGDETFGLRITDISESSSFGPEPVEFTILDDDVEGSVQEVAAGGTVVATLPTLGFDASNVTYKLLDDAGGRFALSGNQIVVADGLLLDYEQQARHAMQVRLRRQPGRGIHSERHRQPDGPRAREDRRGQSGQYIQVGRGQRRPERWHRQRRPGERRRQGQAPGRGRQGRPPGRQGQGRPEWRQRRRRLHLHRPEGQRPDQGQVGHHQGVRAQGRHRPPCHRRHQGPGQSGLRARPGRLLLGGRDPAHGHQGRHPDRVERRQRRQGRDGHSSQGLPRQPARPRVRALVGGWAQGRAGLVRPVAMDGTCRWAFVPQRAHSPAPRRRASRAPWRSRHGDRRALDQQRRQKARSKAARSREMEGCRHGRRACLCAEPARSRSRSGIMKAFCP
ncbi:LigA [Rubellimicrobium mesophilum DSM 19309]|uniref:LigA n=1 Tax=Rubellimicrobium mesophilum DSM 19309 TaxID=442562 RepID=A0A017HPS5_9RHOB|nr:VWA domain-containing protein [Rubellimicrobium mesophilum]EYD76148.1 LigA [Rubellimicrobium mesophilum DSM 19309]